MTVTGSFWGKLSVSSINKLKPNKLNGKDSTETILFLFGGIAGEN